ncbi:uncharacterized protein I303_107581 [Kwoniella dejecticola CBS 10117]|uniref:A-kinase anchor protein 7-like phosphoesterase domain-containing protein n=1 Tax=Kwoniella dejecticola CBS 10117 TaxID=1296121 RepID=A0A1A5ZV46_9TREE|nr:uncharacterized protein I303_07591 [Kwoniella dejecticola CBS 10117]OBR81681.1 hypothetical protein I303_07591 [Kwoniella dejecticola CBS 10117]
MSRQKPTHFLCIPLINVTSRNQLEASLATLKHAATRRIPPEAFRPIGSLHLTLGVMHLNSPAEVDRAIAYLHGEEVRGALDSLGTGPLVCTLSSLSSMRSPKKTSVIYTEPLDSTDRLLPVSRRINELFVKSNLIIPENRPSRLHVTLINTRYIAHVNYPPKVDATKLISEHRDTVWAKDITLDRLAICQMGAEKVLDSHGRIEDEYYEEISHVPLHP